MKKFVFFLFIFYLSFSSVFGKSVRVATYNLENYVIADRWVDGQFFKKYPKPESEKAAIREIIQFIKPDILVVQEMGDISFLKELQMDLKNEGLYYPYIFLSEGIDRERHLAVLSKEVILKTIAHKNLVFDVSNEKNKLVKRGLMELKFKTEDIEWGLFGVHLKSRSSNDQSQDFESLEQRTGEAVVIRNKIKELYSDSNKDNFMIVGDFNDSPKSKALKKFKFLKSGKQEFSKMLSATDSRGEVWTHFRRAYGIYSQIDYVLVSPALMNRVKNESATIVDLPCALNASDHRMVYVDLEF